MSDTDTREGEGEGDAQDPVVAPVTAVPPAAPPVRRRGRRVTTDAVPGSDPTPAAVDRRADSHDNDSRLLADRPPHWG